MSNPLVAPSMPLSAAQSELSLVPQAYFTPDELKALGRDETTGKLLKKKGISIEEVSDRLKGLDMEIHYSFYLSPGVCLEPSLEERLLMGKILATAQMGTVAVRKRSGHGVRMAGAFLSSFVDWRSIKVEDINVRCESVLYAQGGTRNTLGRLKEFYPRVGVKGLQPVSVEEAREAIVRCGIFLDPSVQDLTPRYWRGDGEKITINAASENGFPVMSKWSDERTHGPIIERADAIRSAVVSAYARGDRDGVWNWLRGMEASPETLPDVCLKGKCKADPYKKSKLVDDMMRFYNVFPRSILMNLQMSTQVMESYAQSISPSTPWVKSAIGLTLVRGGCGTLVEALDRNLREDGAAYTHVGDDSWVVIDMGEGNLALFSVDCSSFDLTQHSVVTREVHEAIHGELEKIDGGSAALWYAYARERCVVVVNSMTYRMKHAGPSGFPLQSKVNDCLMDVYLRRVLSDLGKTLEAGGEVDKSTISTALESVGRRMNLVARLEDFYVVQAGTVQDALRTVQFRYIGFLFYVEDDEVRVVADVVRQLAQLQYPNSFFVEKEKFPGMEAVRLAGILISLGYPPRVWRDSFEKMRKLVIGMLEEQKRKGVEDVAYFPDSAFVRVADLDARSIDGLLRAVRRDWGDLWSMGQELEATSEFLGREEVIGVGPRKKAVEPIRPPTHPATPMNLGRPPPNKRWAPDKAKTLLQRIVGLERQAGHGRRGKSVRFDVGLLSDEDMSETSELTEEYVEYGEEFDELQAAEY